MTRPAIASLETTAIASLVRLHVGDEVWIEYWDMYSNQGKVRVGRALVGKGLFIEDYVRHCRALIK